jgi:hypothetical protein
MKTIKEQVKIILTKEKLTRDSEARLSYIFYTAFCEMDSHLSILDFFLRMENKKIPSIQTLTRLSRQLQERHPELRGEKWEIRQRKQKKVKKDLGYEVRN